MLKKKVALKKENNKDDQFKTFPFCCSGNYKLSSSSFNELPTQEAYITGLFCKQFPLFSTKIIQKKNNQMNLSWNNKKNTMVLGKLACTWGFNVGVSITANEIFLGNLIVSCLFFFRTLSFQTMVSWLGVVFVARLQVYETNQTIKEKLFVNRN